MGIHDPTIHVPRIFSVYLGRSIELMIGWLADSSKGNCGFEKPNGRYCTC
jgi:hypothetical protein